MPEQEAKPAIITPRMARDDSKYRDELQKRLSKPMPSQDTLLFDTSGSLEQLLSSQNINLNEMESELWDLVREVYTNQQIAEDLREAVTDMFTFSATFCETLSLSKPENFERLKDQSVLSFTLPDSMQLSMIDDLSGRLSVNNSMDSYHTHFWSCLIVIMQSLSPEMCCFCLGLKPQLAVLIKQLTYAKQLDLFSRYPIKLTLRCSEEVAANILHCEPENLRNLKELKYLQIIYEAMQNPDLITAKFSQLKRMGLY